MGWIRFALKFIAFIALATPSFAIETPVPERFLQPRNFNPHPITDVHRSKEGTLHQLNIPAPSDIYAHYTQRRQPAYKDQEFRQYASLDQQLAYEANVQAYIAEAHRHQEFDTSVGPYVSPTANYDHGHGHTYQHEQYSGTSESPVRHFTQVTQHGNGLYTSKSTHHRSDHFSKKPYSFAYAVVDDLSGDDFSHSQAHNGHATQGEYRVKLPDGRTQVVRYTADNGGYHADVTYEPTDEVADVVPTAAYHQQQAYHLLPEQDVTHVTPSPFGGAAAYPVVKKRFYGESAVSEVIPGHLAKATTDIEPAQLAFEQHLLYKRSHKRRKHAGSKRSRRA
ncbi:uncharacterized protein LOC132200633 [Neocloeon triangulifer]|uniref:uncharacterized protein LOC132200633 n=1 Tax=Neocloeon triangulifer TaxID=2078957 RepID=UPI00286ECC32|nr:uncharacterized protein LOC132200633 [Neocloeon triangulifer]